MKRAITAILNDIAAKERELEALRAEERRLSSLEIGPLRISEHYGHVSFHAQNYELCIPSIHPQRLMEWLVSRFAPSEAADDVRFECADVDTDSLSAIMIAGTVLITSKHDERTTDISLSKGDAYRLAMWLLTKAG